MIFIVYVCFFEIQTVANICMEKCINWNKQWFKDSRNEVAFFYFTCRIAVWVKKKYHDYVHGTLFPAVWVKKKSLLDVHKISSNLIPLKLV